MVGLFDGIEVGEKVGEEIGAREGAREGLLVGSGIVWVGPRVGLSVGGGPV